MTFTWFLSCSAPEELGAQYQTWQPKTWNTFFKPQGHNLESINVALKQCKLLLSSAAEQRQRSVFVQTAESVNLVEIPVSSFHRCFGFINSTQLPRASRRREAESWRHRTGIVQPDEPASPWNKLELLSSWAPASQSPYCPTGACQPPAHTAGDKRERWGAGGE